MEVTRRTPSPRKSYNREFKPRVVEHYKDLSIGNAIKHIIETAKYKRRKRRWIKTEIKLQETHKRFKMDLAENHFYPDNLWRGNCTVNL